MSATAEGLLAAMLAVQKQAPKLKKSATNPHFKSKFAPLDEIVETINPILSAHGLVWSTMPSQSDSGPTLRYRLAHAPSGESEEGEMPLLLSKQDAQGQGSAITYARRYALCAVLNLVADEDDDGARAAQSRGQMGRPVNDTASAPQLKFLRSLITTNNLDAAMMTKLLAGVGVTVGEGEKVNDALKRITRAQCSELIDFIQQGAIPNEGSDVPAAGAGEFEHEPQRPMEMLG